MIETLIELKEDSMRTFSFSFRAKNIYFDIFGCSVPMVEIVSPRKYKYLTIITDNKWSQFNFFAAWYFNFGFVVSFDELK